MNDFGFVPDLGFVPESPEVNQLESLGLGLAQGVSMGYADEIAGGIESVWNKIKGSRKTIPEMYVESRDQQRALHAAAAQQNPATYGAGELAGGVGTMLVPGMGVAKGGLTAIAGKEALRGAATGVGMSQSENVGGVSADAAKSAALNALIGGGLVKGGQQVEKLLKGPATNVRDILATKAVGLKKSDLAKSSLEDLPFLPEFAQKSFGALSEQIPSWKLAVSSKPKVAEMMGDVSQSILDKGGNSFEQLTAGSSTKMLSELAKKKAATVGEDVQSMPGLLGAGVDLLTGGSGVGGLVGGAVTKRQGPQIGTAVLNKVIKAGRLSPETKQKLVGAAIQTPQQANALMYSLQQEDPILREELERIQREGD